MVAFAALLICASAVPVFAATPVEGAEESPSPAEAPAPTGTELAAVEGEEREKVEWLSSPEAERQREASRSIYTSLSPSQAQDLLTEAFSEQLEELNADPARALSELEIEKPLGVYGARVSVGEGESAVIESSVPVESEVGGEGKEPVDLTLEPSGEDFAPQNPLTEVTLPGSSEGPIQLQSGVGVLLPASSDQSAEPLDDKNLFYPETETTTDTLVSPIAGGVEVFEQLRSPESPEQFSFALSLPAGATLRATEGGGAEVVSSVGTEIEEVPPPSAVDAQGSEVPVTLNVVGNSLVLDVPHRSREAAYPILLDPRYNNGYESPPLGQWVPSETAEYNLANNGSSLSAVSKGSNFTYGANTYGQWVYTAPGETTYIEDATFSPIYFLVNSCQTAQPHGYVGIYNVYSGYNSLGVYSGGNVSNASFATGLVGGFGTRLAVLGIGTAGASSTLACAHELYVGGATVQENDPESPTINSVTGIPSGWIGPSTGPVTIRATDPGFGVDLISISSSGGVTSEDHVGCTGMAGSRCPGERIWTIGPAYKEGERTLQVTAEDPTGKVGAWTRTTKVDFTKPEINLGGQLAYVTEEEGLKGEENEASENQLSLPVYNLHIEATDGSNKTPEEKRSGVKNVKVFLDGVEQTVPWGPQECPGGSCKLEGTFPLKLLGLAAGEHKLKVIAIDQVGLEREREIEFEFIPATGMKGEYVMQRFPLPNGEGNEAEEENPVRPELAVNVTNGNLVYRQKDVEVTGPAADLEVERYYNSQLPKADNTEWGAGWTLAQTPKLDLEETKAEAPPSTASMVRTSGDLAGAVPLPTEPAGERFDAKLQALVTKRPEGGYEVADQSGETDSILAFDKAGKVTEELAAGDTTVDYGYENGYLSEIAVDDPASTDATPEEAAGLEGPKYTPINGGQIGSKGSAAGRLSYPGGIARDAKGNLWVADYENHRVDEFNSAGEFILAFGKEVDATTKAAICTAASGHTCQPGNYGTANGDLYGPSGLAIDPKGNIWVADAEESRVQKFNASGEYLSKFGSAGTATGQFSSPVGVAVDAKGSVYVADMANNRIQKFNEAGEFQKAFGSIGTGNGQLSHPYGVAVGAAGNLYVADTNNNRIEVFSETGAYLRQFGTSGTGNGQFKHPNAIVLDAVGRLWVGDEGNSRVQELSQSGTYLNQFGSKGTGEAQFTFSTYPGGIATDAAGNVWVSDSGNGRVQWTHMTPVTPPSEVPAQAVQDDPSVEVNVSGGLVSSVEGEESGQITYSHTGEVLSAVAGPQGETKYEYDSAHRLTKVTLPNGTWGQIAYEAFGRVKSVAVSIKGAKAKTTLFEYSDEPRRTVVTPESERAVTYDIGPDGSVLKWRNALKPPEIEYLSGSLYAQRGEIHPEPITIGDQTLLVQAYSPEGINSIQVVANGNQLVTEKTCEEAKCAKLQKEMVTNTEHWPPGILQLEVIVADRLGQISSERFWDNIPYTPPPGSEAPEPPKFADILRFREEFGFDLDIKGDEQALNERIFNLIADWHNPNTPAGEVARASNERWGVPMRPVDIAEMEYRESYIAQAATAIPVWAESHAPGTYAGYYVDQRQGGIIHVGFTSGQTALVGELKAQVGLIASGRVQEFSGTPSSSLHSLGTMLSELPAKLQGRSDIVRILAKAGVNVKGNFLEVASTEPVSAKSFLSQAFGATAPITVTLAPSKPALKELPRSRLKDQKLYGGDWIEVPGGFCSVGFGASEQSAKKPNQESTFAHFALTAGHCGHTGAAVLRVFKKAASESGKYGAIEIGHVARRSYGEGPNFFNDGEAIRLESGIETPKGIYLSSERSLLSVKGVEPFVVGSTLCTSGSYSGYHCGIATEPFLAFPGEGMEYLIETTSITNEGDSGGSVWDAASGKAVGLVEGGPNGGSTWLTPLLPVPLPGEAGVAPGLLEQLDASGNGPFNIVRGS